MNTHPNLCTTENSLLVLVDIQTKLTAAMTEESITAMLKHTRRLLEAVPILNIPVFVTEQYPQGLGATHPALTEKLPATARSFSKTGFSCCAAEGFNQAIQASNRRQIILTGMETHVCILQTALALIQCGYQVYIVMDAVCSRNDEHKVYALQRMQQLGATISNHESVLFEWLKGASHPDFKAISKLLRE